MSVSISIENVKKIYNGIEVIQDLSLNIKNGEFFTLLGPSGCGKTTLLRMAAGFNTIEGGLIRFDGAVINDIPAHQRNIGMVFQNYAIFPHLSVRQNIEFGLKLRKLPKGEIKEKTDEILAAVKIEQYQDRLPENLSGGQQQRVALARAIVIHPSVLLMDEPLSNLDAKLRVEMRGAIREVQKQVGITTVYVTHDQEEALAISDRIAVMRAGRIQQVGSPHSIYTRPYNVFVSTFIGHSNLFYGTAAAENGRRGVRFVNGWFTPVEKLAETDEGAQVVISVRPEELTPAEEGLRCRVVSSIFLGKYINYTLDFGGGMTLPDQPGIEYSQDVGHAERIYKVGEEITLLPHANKFNVYTADGARSLIEGVSQHEEA